MHCKNCEKALVPSMNYCDECGARVIEERLTLKSLAKDIFVNYLGWDNKFFFTTKSLLLRPAETIQGYLDGTRKKFMNPFGYYGLIITISFLVFSQFENNFVAMNSLSSESNVSESAFELGYEAGGKDFDEADERVKEMQSAYGESMTNAAKGILKYFSIFSFLLLPFYGFMAYLVYGKKHNYGEHLVISAYTQGFLGIISFFVFILVFFVTPRINILSFFLTIIFYLYVYQQLYRQNWKQVVGSFLKFLGVIILGFIAIIIVTVVGLLFVKLLGKVF